VATSLGQYTFSKCSSLTSVNVPALTNVGGYAFYNCALVSISLPSATSIDNSAFYGCSALTSLSLPASPPSLNSNVFYYTQDNNSASTLTILVPQGQVSAYTSAWSVMADTAALGDTYRYGDYHKRILITETP
jgi:hypothetical protein